MGGHPCQAPRPGAFSARAAGHKAGLAPPSCAGLASSRCSCHLDDHRAACARSALRSRGCPLERAAASWWCGPFFARPCPARRCKESTPNLLRNARCRLVVLGVEVGGRWSTRCIEACPGQGTCGACRVAACFAQRLCALMVGFAFGSCVHRLCREPDLFAVAWPQHLDAPDVSRLPAR